MTERNYSYKDVDMLMASQTILQSMSANLPELSLIRTNWTAEYVDDLQHRIELTMDDFLGLDKQKKLREATLFLKNIQQPALKNLSFLKTQIEVDFEEDASIILKSLGFVKSLRTIDQEELIELLYAFKKGMTPELLAQITSKGTNPALIETIIEYASALEQANISQENLKQTTQELSEEAVIRMNTIYREVIGICKIASKFYSDRPLKKEQFTFSKVIKKMGSGTKSPEPTIPQ